MNGAVHAQQVEFAARDSDLDAAVRHLGGFRLQFNRLKNYVEQG